MGECRSAGGRREQRGKGSMLSRQLLVLAVWALAVAVVSASGETTVGDPLDDTVSLVDMSESIRPKSSRREHGALREAEELVRHEKREQRTFDKDSAPSTTGSSDSDGSSDTPELMESQDASATPSQNPYNPDTGSGAAAITGTAA